MKSVHIEILEPKYSESVLGFLNFLREVSKNEIGKMVDKEKAYACGA